MTDESTIKGIAENSSKITIRFMIKRDLPEVLKIESQSPVSSWSKRNFLAALRNMNYICLVAEYDDKVVGFVIYTVNPEYFRIRNLAVDSQYRFMGIGRRLVDRIKDKLPSRNRRKIILELRETNLAAQLFFKRLGFTATDVLRSHYNDTGEDAYLMKYLYRT
jgi:ribosomal-protein-alanine N-acetyltransferase